MSRADIYISHSQGRHLGDAHPRGKAEMWRLCSLLHPPGALSWTVQNEVRADFCLSALLGTQAWRTGLLFCGRVHPHIHLCCLPHCAALSNLCGRTFSSLTPQNSSAWVTMKSLPTLFWRNRSQDRETAPCQLCLKKWGLNYLWCSSNFYPKDPAKPEFFMNPTAGKRNEDVSIGIESWNSCVSWTLLEWHCQSQSTIW